MATSSLIRKMAQLDSTMHSEVEDVIYQTAWSIQGFPKLMKEITETEALETEQLNIQLRGIRSTAWRIKCYPKQMKDGVETVAIALMFCSPNNVTLKASITIGLLDKQGGEEMLREVTQSYPPYAEVAASITHAALSASADRLIPGGRLTAYIKIRLLASAATVVNSEVKVRTNRSHRTLMQQDHPAENIHSIMLESFVDIGPSVVLLACKDGSLLCHTFPLAARNGSGVSKVYLIGLTQK